MIALAGAVHGRRGARPASARRSRPPAWRRRRARARRVRPAAAHARRRRAQLRPGRLPDADARRHREAARRACRPTSTSAASAWRSCPSSATTRVAEPADQVEQPAEQRARHAAGARSTAAFEAVMRNHPRRARRVLAVEPVRREGRRGAHAAARRRAARRHHARVPLRGGAGDRRPDGRERRCTTRTCSAPTKRSSRARRGRSCRSCAWTNARSARAAPARSRAHCSRGSAGRRTCSRGAHAGPSSVRAETR